MRRLLLVAAAMGFVLLACGSSPSGQLNAQLTCSGKDCTCAAGTCDTTCSGDGKSCSYKCEKGADCTFHCPGGSCSADCSGAASCVLDCPGGSCSVSCSGVTGACKVTGSPK